MAYCNANDITAITGNPYRDGSDTVKETRPSLTELNEYLERGQSNIDAKLSAIGIPVPIVADQSPRSYANVQTLNIYWGMHWVSQLDGTVEDAMMYKKMYDDEIAKIEDGKIPFDDTEESGDEPLTQSDTLIRSNFDQTVERVDHNTRF